MPVFARTCYHLTRKNLCHVRKLVSMANSLQIGEKRKTETIAHPLESKNQPKPSIGTKKSNNKKKE